MKHTIPQMNSIHGTRRDVTVPHRMGGGQDGPAYLLVGKESEPRSTASSNILGITEWAATYWVYITEWVSLSGYQPTGYH